MMIKTLGKNREDAVAGDILCAKADGTKFIFDASDYPYIANTEWTPIGIVAVPPSHDIYETGEGAAISLNLMNCMDPDNGYADKDGVDWVNNPPIDPNESVFIYFGGVGTAGYTTDTGIHYEFSIRVGSGIKTRAGCECHGGVFNSQIPINPNNQNNTPHRCPMMKYNISGYDLYKYTTCNLDNNENYYLHAYDSTKLEKNLQITNPVYLSDGSRNFDFFTYDSTIGNSKDLYHDWFDGKQICQTILDVYDGKSNDPNHIGNSTFNQGQPQWKTQSNIINKTVDSQYIQGPNGILMGPIVKLYFPLLCCCWRYHTIGTNQGDWYLPAVGEVMYALARGADIVDTYKNLGYKYHSQLGNNEIDGFFRQYRPLYSSMNEYADYCTIPTCNMHPGDYDAGQQSTVNVGINTYGKFDIINTYRLGTSRAFIRF